jgi:molecular chaperone GrpE
MTEEPETRPEREEGSAVDTAEPETFDAAETLDAAEAAEAAEPHADGAAAVADDLEALTAKARERDEYLALAQRTQADFENYRKRMAKEVGAAEARGTAKLARELLPALDNLARALDAATPEDEHLAQGIRLVQKDLRAALARLRIESFSPRGEPFDPNEHEAMAQQPVEGAEPGTVVEVYEDGYRHGDIVLRPARVVVAA